MKELTEVAAKYAAEKTNEVMINAIAKAYADGYRDGYKDREEEIPIDLRSNETEYVDLGLPSGTLWSTDYETIDGETLFLTHEDASNYAIPTKEQWRELMSYCGWSYGCTRNNSQRYDCIGPNGNIVSFFSEGLITTSHQDLARMYFWLTDQGNRVDKNAAYVYKPSKSNLDKKIEVLFVGYKLPLRLVRTKKE